jgi:hypothetical protein
VKCGSILELSPGALPLVVYETHLGHHQGTLEMQKMGPILAPVSVQLHFNTGTWEGLEQGNGLRGWRKMGEGKDRGHQVTQSLQGMS